MTRIILFEYVRVGEYSQALFRHRLVISSKMQFKYVYAHKHTLLYIIYICCTIVHISYSKWVISDQVERIKFSLFLLQLYVSFRDEKEENKKKEEKKNSGIKRIGIGHREQNNRFAIESRTLLYKYDNHVQHILYPFMHMQKRIFALGVTTSFPYDIPLYIYCMSSVGSTSIRQWHLFN